MTVGLWGTLVFFFLRSFFFCFLFFNSDDPTKIITEDFNSMGSVTMCNRILSEPRA